MPGYDRTGPAGQGPMTGRRGGYCRGGSPDANDSLGYGQGRGRMQGGFGRGQGRSNNPQYLGPSNGQDMPESNQGDSAMQRVAGALEKLVKKLDKGD